MNIGKVKTVFIFLFLIINIFLVYVSLYFESDSIHITSKEIERTEKILLNYNVTMNKNIVNSVYNNMHYVSIINPVASKTDFAYTLTGSSVGSNLNFNGKKGRLNFKDGGFLFFPKDSGKKIKSALPSQSAATKVLNTLSSYGFKTQNLKWQGSVLRDEYYEISYIANYQGFDFFNSELKCLADENGIYNA